MRCVGIDLNIATVTRLRHCLQTRNVRTRSRSECVRLKNFVTGAIISGNTIRNCGIYDYQLDGGEKNGEGIYVGTSINQVPGSYINAVIAPLFHLLIHRPAWKAWINILTKTKL